MNIKNAGFVVLVPCYFGTPWGYALKDKATNYIKQELSKLGLIIRIKFNFRVMEPRFVLFFFFNFGC